MSTDDEYHLFQGEAVLHTLLLVALGLCLVGILSAVFEQLFARLFGVPVGEVVHLTWGLSIEWWSTILAVGFVACAAWTHTWTRLLIATGVAILLLMLRRDLEKWAERKAKKQSAQTDLRKADDRDHEHAP
jgi:hypothetical protein